jgi:uncharacterized phage protein (TIGR02218 family)
MTTLDELEESQAEGRPGECYRFASGSSVWTWTSADRQLAIPAGSFTPATIRRSRAEYSQEENTESIEVTVPRNNPVAALFIRLPPTNEVGLTIYRGPRDDVDEFIAIWQGRVTSARFVGSEAILLCATVTQAMKREVPTLAYQRQCPLVVYSAECGADPTTFRDVVTITTVSGRTLTSNDFDLRADGWFDGGMIVGPDGTPRFVVSHVGDTVTLLSPFLDLDPLDVVDAYRGCDRTLPTCRDVFGRLEAHIGFHLIPTRNPLEGRID